MSRPEPRPGRPRQPVRAGAGLGAQLLVDEPTDHLDLASAEALQEGLESYEGTVLAVTRDRWSARSLDRFLLVAEDGSVRETPEPVWDEPRRTSQQSM